MNHLPKASQRLAKTVLATLTLACFSILIAGCQPTLSFEKQYSLTPADIMALPIDPIGVEQTIHVAASSTDDAQFDIHVYLAKNEEAAEQEINSGSDSDMILAASTDTKNANLSAKIPANEEAVVRISARGKTVTVDVAINN